MRVLIVDDSSFMREYLWHVLQKMGIVCEAAGNGSEALEALQSGKDFHLMLLDENMPAMNGVECVSAMRKARLGEKTKVMMVTAQADSEYVQRALDAGANECLVKPFTADSLREKMRLMGFAAAA